MSLYVAATELPTAVSIPLTPFWIAVFFIGIIVVGVPGLIGALNGFLTLVARFKQVPPLHELYATKQEVKEADGRVLSKLEEVKKQLKDEVCAVQKHGHEREVRLHEHISSMDKHHDATQAELKSINHQLGELFGMLTNPDKRKPR